MSLDSPHDALFKQIFSNPEYAAVELRAVLPPSLVAAIDWITLQVVPSSFVEVGASDRYADLLYRVSLGGQTVFLYLLFEHQSAVDRMMPARMLIYSARVYDRILREKPQGYLTPVLPIVLHHSDSGWNASLEFHDLFDPKLLDGLGLRPFVPSFRFLLDDLSHASDEDLHRRAKREADKVVPVVLWALRDSRSDRERLLASLTAWLSAISIAHRAPSGKDAIQAVLQYINRVAEHVTPKDILAIADSADPETKDTFMTLAEQWMQLGIEKGIEKGMEKGERSVLLKQLTLKFGALDAPTRAKVEAASLPDLELWSERILTATSLGELFAD